MEAKEIKRENYTIQTGYSEEAKEKKLLKFISKSGDEFEISAEEMSAMLIGGVNQNTLEATFVEADKINVVEVGRQLKCILDKDMKKGEEIRLNYAHPYPLEFAIIEQVMGIAKINMDVPALTLTKEYIDEIKKKLKPDQEKFIKKFYMSFKNVEEKN
ncbi:MAG: hypothetical protein KAS32_24965 [Candidatus Peribacteraceae bacterium]|nr:hypothetical protein [Candidatus Peribacteraceae bacterium]